jgi:hypothetical protein
MNIVIHCSFKLSVDYYNKGGEIHAVRSTENKMVDFYAQMCPEIEYPWKG